MQPFNIWRVILITVAGSLWSLIFYDDEKGKPFGWRYWLSLAGTVVVVLFSLASLFLFFASISLLVRNQSDQGSWWLTGFLLLLALALTVYAYFAVKTVRRRTQRYKKESR